MKNKVIFCLVVILTLIGCDKHYKEKKYLKESIRVYTDFIEDSENFKSADDAIKAFTQVVKFHEKYSNSNRDFRLNIIANKDLDDYPEEMKELTETADNVRNKFGVASTKLMDYRENEDLKKLVSRDINALHLSPPKKSDYK